MRGGSVAQDLQRDAVINEYEAAVRTGATSRAQGIRIANPDCATAFDGIDKNYPKS